MRRTLTSATVLMLVWAAAAEAQPRPTPVKSPSTRRVAPPTRAFISVNGGFQVSANDFDDSETFREYGEDGRYTTDYTVKGGPTLDIAGGMRVWRSLALGAGVTRFSRSTPVALNGSIPHPFFFSRPRSVTGEITSLKREELAVHVQARALLPVGRRFQVMAFGGPSFFQVKQGIVTDFSYSESYPYDSAAYASAETTNAKESKVAFNVGGDVAFFFTRQIGIGLSLQFSGAEVDLPAANGDTQQGKIGGLQTGAGLRLRF